MSRSYLAAGSTLTDNGTMTFASGDTVALQGGVGGCCSAAPSPILVGGTLKAINTTFNGAASTITANSSGHVIASSSVFNIGSLNLTNNSVLYSGRPGQQHVQHAHLRSLRRRGVPRE